MDRLLNATFNKGQTPDGPPPDAQPPPARVLLAA
jgi:hypothetical protein